MNFFKICYDVHYNEKTVLRKIFKRCYSVESKPQKLNCPSINEYINIPQLYKYLTSRFYSIDSLRENVFRRKKKHQIDTLHEKFIYLRDLFMKKNYLEYLKFENAKLISDIKTKGGTMMNLEIDKIKNKGRRIKEDLKDILKGPNGYRNMENSLLPELITLPVDLDLNTPDNYVTLQEEKIQNPIKDMANHLDLCKHNISFCQHEMNKNDEKLTLRMHYLENDLSKLEIYLVRWLHNFMNANSNYEHIISPDMVKKYIADLCEDEKEKLLSLDTNMGDANHDLVLTGNSLSTYISYLTSLDDHINSTNHLFRIGSSYKHELPNNLGLYQVSQNMQLDIFSTSACEKSSKLLFEESVGLLKELYASLDLPCKLVSIPAYDLLNFESRKVEVFLWSCGFKQYIRSGFVRSCRDIFSRCFELKYQNNYLFMNHGVLINVPQYLAALIEKNQSSSLSTMKS